MRGLWWWDKGLGEMSTDPPSTRPFPPVSQTRCHGDDPAVMEAGSHPVPLLQGHKWTLFRLTDVNAAVRLADMHTFGYHWLLCHYHPQGLQRGQRGYFELHK